ncbi:MAG: hypothetical protein JW384_03702 [Nitrosomonadaceae bacterium]|nr:hypothetical protein [Nitrosomonadaceae bacterium]
MTELDEAVQLEEACKRGNVDVVMDLLREFPQLLDSPDHADPYPYKVSHLWSPLYLAAKNGHAPLVLALLELGANPVPYEVAGQYHHFTYGNWIDDLRERGYEGVADAIERAVRERYGPLLDAAGLRQAVADGDMELVQALLAENPGRIVQVDHIGNTLLHMAVAASRLEMVTLLVEYSAAVDARNGDGRTPAVVALFGLHRYWREEAKPEIVDYLLKKGAAYTLLLAASVGDEVRVRELLGADKSRTLANQADPCHRRPLSAAVSSGHRRIAQLLLQHGADPNAKEAVCQGGLSLHRAAGKGDVETVRLLLDHGAVPAHWVDSSGDAMFIAHHGQHKRVVQMLYAAGGTMELMVYAAQYRIDVIAEVLKLQPSLANEVLPYSWDDSGNDELASDIMKLAIRYGARFEKASTWNMKWTILKYPKVFKLLQEHGANPDLLLFDIAGDLSRRFKTESVRLEAIRFLIEECGADVNSSDEEGFTALAKAAKEGCATVVKYLLLHGAGMNKAAPDWAQPFYLANKHGHSAILDQLKHHKL